MACRCAGHSFPKKWRPLLLVCYVHSRLHAAALVELDPEFTCSAIIMDDCTAEQNAAREPVCYVHHMLDCTSLFLHHLQDLKCHSSTNLLHFIAPLLARLRYSHGHPASICIHMRYEPGKRSHGKLLGIRTRSCSRC
jgi:hypothetical protein